VDSSIAGAREDQRRAEVVPSDSLSATVDGTWDSLSNPICRTARLGFRDATLATEALSTERGASLVFRPVATCWGDGDLGCDSAKSPLLPATERPILATGAGSRRTPAARAARSGVADEILVSLESLAMAGSFAESPPATERRPWHPDVAGATATATRLHTSQCRPFQTAEHAASGADWWFTTGISLGRNGSAGRSGRQPLRSVSDGRVATLESKGTATENFATKNRFGARVSLKSGQ
jgi:hypothetical protein